MFRRLQRTVFVLFIFFLLWSTLNYLIGNEKQVWRGKIEPLELKSMVENPLTLVNVRIYPEVENYEMKDWHDYEFMAYEGNRTGPGENGSAVFLTDPDEIKLSEELLKIEGLNVMISDKISVNRSLPDVRHKS